MYKFFCWVSRKQCFSLWIIPTGSEVLVKTVSVWLLKQTFCSIESPRIFSGISLQNKVVFYQKQCQWKSFPLRKQKHFHLWVINDDFISVSHSLTFDNSKISLFKLSSSSYLPDEHDIFVSSANKQNLKSSLKVESHWWKTKTKVGLKVNLIGRCGYWV